MERTCLDCPTTITGRGKTGRCRPCFLTHLNRSPEIVAKRSARRIADNKARRLPRPRCECGKEITLGAKRCKPCNMKAVLHTPEVKRRSSATMRLRHRSDPDFHERHRESVTRALHRRMEDPAYAAARSELGQRTGRLNIGFTRTPEARAKAARAISAARLAHIPADQRDLYRDLMRKKISAADRERLVLEHAATEQERAPRLVQQFEQQMRLRDERRQREAY